MQKGYVYQSGRFLEERAGIGLRMAGHVLWRNMWPLRTQQPQIQGRIYEGPLFRQDVGSCDRKRAAPYSD